MKFFSIKNDTPASRQKVWVITGTDDNPKVMPAVFEPGKADDEWDHGTFHVSIFVTDGNRWPIHVHPDSDVMWAPWQAPGMDEPVKARRLHHVGYDEHRLNVAYPDNGEMAFAKAWVDKNAERGSCDFLPLLIPQPTQRDAKVAATIIQWLGTNIGSGFLAEVIRKSPEMANFLSRPVKHQETKSRRDQKEKLRGDFKILLQGVSRVIPDLKKAERGTNDHLLMMTIIELSQSFGMPHIQVDP